MGQRAPQPWKEIIEKIEDQEEAGKMWCVLNRRAKLEIGPHELGTQYLLPFYKKLVVLCFDSFIELM